MKYILLSLLFFISATLINLSASENESHIKLLLNAKMEQVESWDKSSEYTKKYKELLFLLQDKGLASIDVSDYENELKWLLIGLMFLSEDQRFFKYTKTMIPLPLYWNLPIVYEYPYLNKKMVELKEIFIVNNLCHAYESQEKISASIAYLLDQYLSEVILSEFITEKSLTALTYISKISTIFPNDEDMKLFLTNMVGSRVSEESIASESARMIGFLNNPSLMLREIVSRNPLLLAEHIKVLKSLLYASIPDEKKLLFDDIVINENSLYYSYGEIEKANQIWELLKDAYPHSLGEWHLEDSIFVYEGTYSNDLNIYHKLFLFFDEKL